MAAPRARAWSAKATRTRRSAPTPTGLERANLRTLKRRDEALDRAAVEAEETNHTDVLLQRPIDAASHAEHTRRHAMSEDQCMSLLCLTRDQDAAHDTLRLHKRT